MHVPKNSPYLKIFNLSFTTRYHKIYLLNHLNCVLLKDIPEQEIYIAAQSTDIVKHMQKLLEAVI